MKINEILTVLQARKDNYIKIIENEKLKLKITRSSSYKKEIESYINMYYSRIDEIDHFIKLLQQQ